MITVITASQIAPVTILTQRPATHIVQTTRESATVTEMTRCGPGSVAVAGVWDDSTLWDDTAIWSEAA